MKKIFPLILVLLFMLISSVSAEEEIVNLAAVYHADGSITLIGSTTAKYWLVEDMVLVYKEGEDPEEDSPLFFYHISGGDTFSITHPAPYCWHTDRKDEFRDVERMILKPGRYFAIIKRGSLTEDTILSDPAYFTVPSEIVSSSPIPTQTSTLAPTHTPTEEPTSDATAKPTSGKTALPVHTASPAPKVSSGIGTIHIVAYVILGVIICAELVVICYLAKKKK